MARQIPEHPCLEGQSEVYHTRGGEGGRGEEGLEEKGGKKDFFQKGYTVANLQSLGFKGQSNETGPLLLPFLSN